MYTSKVSAKVTFALTIVFCVLLAVLMVYSPCMLRWFFGSGQDEKIRTIMITFYSCCPAAITALVSILILMKNIINEQIFIQKNVFSMRLLSWCCAAVAIICFAAGWFYVPFWIFSLGAAFMTLILRVLKSVMAKATEIKDENEFTI